MLMAYPNFYPGIAQIAGLLTSLKWVFIFSTMMMLVVRLAHLGWQRWAQKKQSEV